MSKECLTNYEVATKIDGTTSIETVNEYSTVEMCTEMGADSTKLLEYPTIYECPADDDIVRASKITYRCTPGNNKFPFQFLDDGTWRENLNVTPSAWMCDMDRTDIFGEDSSIIDNSNEDLLGVGDLLIVKFHPLSPDSQTRSLLGIQDIDDGTVGLFTLDRAISADYLVWEYDKNGVGYTNNEVFYNNIESPLEWAAIWRTSEGIYLNYWLEDDNITNVDSLVDDIILSPIGYLWIRQSDMSGTNINGNYVNIGQPHFNSGMYDPSQFYDVYWIDVAATTQTNIAIEGFYSCKDVIK